MATVISSSAIAPTLPVLPTQGKAIILTDAVDNINGSALDELFIATNATLNRGDVLTGGGGGDMLSYTASGAGAVNAAGFSTSGIQSFFVSSDAAGGTHMDLSGTTGLIGLINRDSATSVSFDNAPNLMALALQNVTGGDTTVNYAKGIADGKADTMNVTLRNSHATGGGSVGTIQADGIETFNIQTANGASDINQIRSNTLKAVNITGDQNLALHHLSFTNPGGVNLVNASSLTGKLDLALDNGGQSGVQTLVLGGHSTDTLHFAGARADYQVSLYQASTFPAMPVEPFPTPISVEPPQVLVHDLRMTLAPATGAPAAFAPVTDVRASAVERLAFADQNLALDMGANQAGGKTVLALGISMGSHFVENQALARDILKFFDGGASLQDGFTLLLSGDLVAGLAGGSSNAALVGFAYKNVFGTTPDAATLAALTAPLDNHSMTQAQWLSTVAQIDVVQQQVHLAGYAQTGLAYAL